MFMHILKLSSVMHRTFICFSSRRLFTRFSALVTSYVVYDVELEAESKPMLQTSSKVANSVLSSHRSVGRCAYEQSCYLFLF